MAAATQNVARSLTTRINRKISDADTAAHGIINRAFSTRKPQEKIPYRPEISLPIELLSATNPLAFTAPDIHPQQSTPGSASTGKFSFSTAQTLASTASSTSLRSDSSVPGLSTSSSIGSPSPLQTPVNEVEHEFTSDKRLTTLAEIEAEASIAARLQETLEDEDKLAVEAPIVPKRAPSHTKKAHQGLHRQRSLSRIGARSPSANAGPRSPSGSSLTEDESRKSSSSAQSNGRISTQSLEKDANGVKVVRNSIDIFASSTHTDGSSKDHPFGAELAKLDEMAEEFSPTKTMHDEEAKEEPKQALRRERSFKALRRGLSRKEKKVEPESESEAEPSPGLQRQRSFKVLRRDPSTKELKSEDQASMPALEKTLTPVEEHIAVVPRERSRHRATTITRDEQPAIIGSVPRTPTKSRSVRQPRPTKVAVPPSEPTIWDDESEYLNKHGLRIWSAEDYISEIGSPFESTFGSSQTGWL